MSDLSILSRVIRGTVLVERPARSPKILEKKPPDSGKTGNEGILRIRTKTVRPAGLILLIDGEVAPKISGARRVQSNRYPDFGLKPHSRLPGLSTSGLGNL